MAPLSLTARAPGRVNLLGEHTDYNDGFVFPMALPFETVMVVRRRNDDQVCLSSSGYGEIQFTLGDDPSGIESWGRYVAGMLHMLSEDGVPLIGFDANITTTIPVGASLSSSAALEVATGFACSALAGIEPDPKHIAALGQRVENEVVGIQSGIMDQLISAAASEKTATLIDCRSLELTPVALPADSTVVIMDTMTRRELVESEYDARREACERAAAALGVSKLRDATLEQVRSLPEGIDRTRATHVVTENARVLDAVQALEAGDIAAFGRAMNESHDSLRDDFDVSAPALDLMVDIARGHKACIGARMTGGGFAGCAVALVSRHDADAFMEHVRNEYARQHGTVPDLWAVDPAPGASVEVDD